MEVGAVQDCCILHSREFNVALKNFRKIEALNVVYPNDEQSEKMESKHEEQSKDYLEIQ